VTATALTAANADDLHRCSQFLFREAALLDRRKLPAWLELFAPDATYWVPLREHYTDPESELNIVYDDLSRLRERVERLDSGIAYAQDPPSRTARVLSNVTAERSADGFVTDAVFVLYELRASDIQLLAGRYRHELVAVDGDLRIRHKRVELVNRTEPFFNLSFIL
jgi:3-phenylpropionate/cinnamic acid dioxygenase small subunit